MSTRKDGEFSLEYPPKNLMISLSNIGENPMPQNLSVPPQGSSIEGESRERANQEKNKFYLCKPNMVKAVEIKTEIL